MCAAAFLRMWLLSTARKAGCPSRLSICRNLLPTAMYEANVMDYKTLQDTVGNTPLVQLQRLGGHPSNTLLAKLEGNNPAGSVKDRPALYMFMEAEREGRIKPGDHLIEATSGNTGIALAMVAAMRG